MPVSTAAPVLTPNKLVLASGSSIRRHLLEAAGVPVAAYPVDIDEEHLRHQAQHDGLSLKETALFLARAKAHRPLPGSQRPSLPLKLRPSSLLQIRF